MSLPFDDRGFTLGDGLFETMLANEGELVGFEAHAARMARGCKILGLPAPGEGALRQAALAALAEAGLASTRAAVRLTWTAGSGGRGLPRPERPQPRLIAAAAPSARPTSPAILITASLRRNETSPASGVKSLSYLDNVLARREAQAAGADEALMLNTGGAVACATAANIFWLAGGRLFTPALEAGVLAGIVRAEIIAAARAAGVDVEEVVTGPDALAYAEAAFLTNSLVGVRFVSALDGRPFAQQAVQVTEWLSLGRR